MTLAIAKITPAMFQDIYRSLLRDWNPGIGEAAWRQAFQWTPSSDEGCSGYVMTDGSRIVGVLGMIFSDRQIDGRAARFCNLHSWRVDPEYRARSLLLLRPLAKLKEYTLTDLTSSEDVMPIMKRVGFKTLDRAATVLPWLPRMASDQRAAICAMTEPPTCYQSVLSPADLQIYQDHQALDCGHLLAQTADGYCYVVFSSIAQRWRPHCSVHYISNHRLFAEHHGAFRSHLMRASRRRSVVIASRLLNGLRIPYGFSVRTNEMLYRSDSVNVRQIDNLYTELVILKNSTLPPFRARLRGLLREFTPARVRGVRLTTL